VVKKDNDKFFRMKQAVKIIIGISFFSQVLFSQDLTISKLKLFAKELFRIRIITEDSLRRLDKAIENGKVTQAFDILPYCKRARVIRFTDQPSSRIPAQKYLERIYSLMISVLPDSCFGKLDICEYSFGKALCCENSDLISDKVVECPERTKPGFLWQIKITDNTSDDSLMALRRPCKCINDESELVKCCNDFLNDHASPYRIKPVYRFSVEYDTSLKKNNIKMADSLLGIVALTEEESRYLFSSEYNFWKVGEGEYSGFISKKNIKSALDTYLSLGLFDHLKQPERARINKKVIEGKYINLNEVISQFPNTICSYNRFPAQNNYTYSSLTADLAILSKGAFSPSQITDDYSAARNENRDFVFSFQMNGKAYKRQFLNHDVQDVKFLQLINFALAQSNSNGKFYHLFVSKQSGLGTNARAIIYLTNQQYAVLKKYNLLTVMPEEGLTEEEWPSFIKYAQDSWQKLYKK